MKWIFNNTSESKDYLNYPREHASHAYGFELMLRSQVIRFAVSVCEWQKQSHNKK